MGEGLRLGAQRKRPRVVREVIDHHQIVLITRKAKYRRSTGHSEQDQMHASHAKKKKKKEAEHDDQAGTHGRGAQQEP